MSEVRSLSRKRAVVQVPRPGAARARAGFARRLGRWLSDEAPAFAGMAFAAGGFAVALYLTIVHYTHQQIACNGIGDCEYVNSSEYAELMGVPVALVGAVAYASVFALGVLWRWRRDETLLLVAWGLAMASFAFSVYLTYIELFVIDAICVYCVVSAVMATAMFASLSLAVWLRSKG
jgi:uncharacterized membrane protein